MRKAWGRRQKRSKGLRRRNLQEKGAEGEE